MKKDDDGKIIEQKLKLSFNGFHKSYPNYDSYTFKQNEVSLNKPIYRGLAILELSNLLTYEFCYDKLQR